MKILALVTDAFGGYGGIAQYNRDFLSALADMEGIEEVHVRSRVAPERVEDIPENIVQHQPIAGRLAYSAAAMAHAVRMRPTIIYCGHLYHGPLAVLVARITGAKLISQLHGTEIWGGIALGHRRPLIRSDIVFCVSRDTKRRYLAAVNLPRDNAIILHNTVSEAFTPGDRDAARRKFGLGGETTILTVARLDGRGGYKGHDRIIDALPSLRADGRDILYLIAGEGEDQARLELRAHQMGVADHVRFLGKVPQRDLPDLYRAADLFALPSAGEGFGIVFLEAMACGTPAIGLNVGGAPDALGDGDLGWSVSEDDFAAALACALNTPPRSDATPLSSIVQKRFGRRVFRERIAQALYMLRGGAS